MATNLHEHTTALSTPRPREIRMERTFDAPCELVWQAFTDPKLLPEWLGPRALTMTVEEMDPSPGGAYRFIHRDEAGHESVFFGEMLEIVPHELIVRTFNFEGIPGKESVERAEFEDFNDGRTHVIATASYDSEEDRDDMLQSGMERGVRESHERLDELLTRMQNDA